MDKFEAKVRNALNNLENEGKIKSTPVDENNLVDPFMQEESPEALEKKKALWNDIFNQYPEFADSLIDFYQNHTNTNFGKITEAIKTLLATL